MTAKLFIDECNQLGFKDIYWLKCIKNVIFYFYLNLHQCKNFYLHEIYLIKNLSYLLPSSVQKVLTMILLVLKYYLRCQQY